MKSGTNATLAHAGRGTFTLERICRAPLGRLWELWTTPAGLRHWWGPAGFGTRILRLEARPGGDWRLTLTAQAPALVKALRGAGVPLTTHLSATYTEVLAPRRLRYTSTADVPGVAPYEVAVLIELYAAGEEALIVVTADALHEAPLTERSRAEWDGRLDRLARQLR